MGGAFWWLFTQLDVWIPTLMSYVPDWLQWLSYLLWPLAVISVLLVFGYFFSTGDGDGNENRIGLFGNMEAFKP